MRDEWSEQIDAERDRFVDELVSRGFRLVGTTPQRQLVGELTYPPNGERTTVEVILPGWMAVQADKGPSYRVEGALVLAPGSRRIALSVPHECARTAVEGPGPIAAGGRAMVR